MLSYLLSRLSSLATVTDDPHAALNSTPAAATMDSAPPPRTTTSPTPQSQHPKGDSKPTLLSLPTELRLEILAYVLAQDPHTGFHTPDPSVFPFPFPASTGLALTPSYKASTHIALLLTCRQFRTDFTQLAFRNTHFVVADTFTSVRLRERLGVLCPMQIEALRTVNLVVSRESQMRELCAWEKYPFDWEPGTGMGRLELECLNVVFKGNGGMLNPHGYTHKLVALLRRLDGITKVRFIRNGANIKGYFKPWYNRLIGLMLKEDHHHRYDFPGGPCLPLHWWEWHFFDEEQMFEFVAREPLDVVEESVYMEIAKPLVEELMKIMLAEEMDPEPRARVGW